MERKKLETSLHVVLGPRGSGKTTLIKHLLKIWKHEYADVFAWMNGAEFPNFAAQVPRSHLTTCPIKTFVEYRKKQATALGTQQFFQLKPTVLVFDSGVGFPEGDIQTLLCALQHHRCAVFVTIHHFLDLPVWARCHANWFWSLPIRDKGWFFKLAPAHDVNLRGTMFDPTSQCHCPNTPYTWLWGSPPFEKQPGDYDIHELPQLRITAEQVTGLIPPLLDLIQSYMQPYATCSSCSRFIPGVLIKVQGNE